jgi:outer membrane protein insertion porin family
MRCVVALVCCFVLVAAGDAAWAQATQGATIESLNFRGNRRVPVATMRARIFSQSGDVYDEAALRRDFMALYNTGLFDDITLHVEDGETGKIVTFEVRERPIIRSIEYKGNSSVTQSDILDRFKERNVGLTVESRYDPTRIKRAQVVLQQLLAERGRQLATINVETKDIPPSSVALTFNINEGPKVKVGDIEFEGNAAISDGKLRRSMRNLRPYGIPYSLIFSDLWNKTYDQNKLDEDLERVRGAYQDRGYFRVLVNQPKLENKDTGGGWFRIPWIYPNRRGRAVDITIPVVEGDKYYLGEMTFQNSTVFRDQQAALRSLFQMKEGELFNVSRIRSGLEELRKLYGEFGYINFVASPETEVDDANHRIDMTFNFEEGKQFTVRRIEFSGNTTTRDKVIRRELLIQEGALFNSRLWELSILRLNQLDYFERLDPGKDAQVQTNNTNGTVDISLKVSEKGKNSIGFSGGVSGLSGSFVGFNYQTNNFMGLGETLTFDAQLGSVERNVLLGLTHPYLFDRPLQTGFTFFSRRYTFDEGQQASIFAGQDLGPIFDLLGSDNVQNYRQSSVGFTAFASYPLRNFTRVGLTYGYENSTIKTFSTISRLLFEDINFNGLSGADSLEGIRTSKITPSYNYSTVDSALTPSRGTAFFASMEFSGIGGNVRTYRPTIDFKWFHPFTGGGRTFGMHLLGFTISGYGGRVIPPFARSFAGGENDIRGFDLYTISPVGFMPDTTAVAILNANGTPRISSGPNAIGQEDRAPASMTIPVNRITFPGGDTKAIGNFEYRIPLFGPVSLAPFLDIGLNVAWKRSQLELTERRQLELASAFPSVNFNQKVEIAARTNQQWRASTGIELKVIMPVVNVPFRVYWAYNPLRLETIIHPPSLLERAMFPNQASYENAVNTFASPRVYNEPRSTFRFTIGTTF